MKKKSLFIFLLLVMFTQACAIQAKPEMTAAPETEKPLPIATRALPTPTALIAATEIILPTETPAPGVTITAVKGNLFIRRGPDMAYNPIGVLYKNSVANAYARDVLSKWAQINIPNSTGTGWVSLMTEYSKVEGDLNALPEFKITDWPLPSYVRNCTHHRLYLTPGNIYIDSEIFEPENLAWVYPGHYRVFDIDMPDAVELDAIDTSEGATVDIRIDGKGERRKCE